jgi:hypothetical protein
MTNWYNTGRTAQRWRKLALAAFLATGATMAQAQTLNYGPGGFSNQTGTYTDLGTTGTVITTANNDDANSAATSIGFTFTFNGTAFTDFVLNTNGFIKLGTTAPAPPYYFATSVGTTGGPLSSTGTENNIIAPFDVDLIDGTSTAEYRIAVTGTAGSRVATIQWKNVKDKARTGTDNVGTQYANFSFQAKLYEGSGRIEFVYGTATAGAAADVNPQYVAVGIKGSGTAANQAVVLTKGSTGAWSTTTASGGAYAASLVNAHNIRSSVLPDPGRTYRFLPSVANDATVAAIYTLGKLPIPFGVPHTIQAVVRNVGQNTMTNVSVTASTPAPNTYTSTKTVATLAAGATATVTFDPYTPTTAATQTVTVTLGNDDNTTNNASSWSTPPRMPTRSRVLLQPRRRAALALTRARAFWPYATTPTPPAR